MKKKAKVTKLPGCFLSPTVDLVFKKLFGTTANKNLTINLLNAILELPEEKQIVQLTFNDPSNHLETLRQKFSIVDIRCTDKLGSQYIIEMQNDDYHNFTQRAQYYGACGLSSQLAIAEEYGTLLPVIFVGVVNFTLFNRHNRYISNHVTIDKEDNACDLNLIEYHFIELPKFNKTVDQLETLVDQWIYFIKCAGSINKIPAQFKNLKQFTNAFQVLMQSAWTEEEMALYQAQVDARRVEIGVLETAETKGLEQGLKQGREQGLEQGLERRSLEIAHAMLADGFDNCTIAKITGLTIDTINGLSKK